jgi:MFS superfamily sulfate permease-like transporter
MPRRAIVIFPELLEASPIFELRRRFDPLAELVPPHLTLVFPFDSELTTGQMRDHVQGSVTGIAAFPVRLSQVTGSEGEYLFLNIKYGNDGIIALHDRLYTGLLENLPKAVLAAVVLTAIYGLFDIAALRHMWRVSRMDFTAAAIALVGVLALGILPGILLAALASAVLLLMRASRPNVAFLGRIPGTQHYSDMARHPENEPLPGVIAFRPEASLLYVNADSVLAAVLDHLGESSDIRLVVCDLSASPNIDLAGSRMLHELHNELTPRNIALRILGARGNVRDLLRADGLAEKAGGLDRAATLDNLIGSRASRFSDR